MPKKHTEQYASLSLNGRLAVALCCVEKYFRAKNISHVEIEQYFNWMWEALYYPNSSEGFDDWENREPDLFGAALGWEFPDGFEAFLIRNGQSPEEFRWIICFATEVYYSSMFSKPQKESSLAHLSKVLGFVEKHGISLPEPSVFNDSNWDDYDGWGRRLTVEEAMSWRRDGTGRTGGQEKGGRYRNGN